MSDCSVSWILIKDTSSLYGFAVFTLGFQRKSLFRIHEYTIKWRLLIVNILLHISWALYRHIYFIMRTISYSILTYDLHWMLFMPVSMIYIATLDLNFRPLQPFLMLCRYNPTYLIITPLTFIFVHGPPSLATCIELILGEPTTITFVTHCLLLNFF